MIRPTWRAYALALLALAAPLTAQSPQPQQPPPPPTGIIVGRAVDATTGRPVSGATATLNVPAAPGPGGGRGPAQPPLPGSTPVGPRRVTTGGDGVFVFHTLPQLTSSISVTAPGYLPGQYGQTRVQGPARPIELDAGEHAVDVTIKLWKLAAITGTVTDELGEPVVNVNVQLMRYTLTGGAKRATPANSTRTDDRGIYRFASLPPGEYLVVVPQTITSLPVATMDAYLSAMANGGREMSDLMRKLSESQAPTPDMGIKIGGQQFQANQGSMIGPPVVGANGRLAAYRTVYFPSSDTMAEATTIALEAGAERTAVDVQMRVAPAFAVSGVVSGPDGPAGNLGLRLTPAGANPYGFGPEGAVATTASDALGRFTFPAVPAGQYSVSALKVSRPVPPPPPPPPPLPAGGAGRAALPAPPVPPVPPARQIEAEPTLWAEQPVVVADGDLANVVVSMRLGSRIRGRIVFEGTQQPPPNPFQRMSVGVSAADGRDLPIGSSGQVQPDGTFTTMGYPPGRYTISSGVGIGGWSLRGVQLGSRPLDDDQIELQETDISGITIVFTDTPTELAVSVRAAAGGGELEGMLFVFPANYQPWVERGMPGRRGRSLTLPRSGTLTITGLPAGEYILAAIGMETAGETRDLAFYRKISGSASRVTVIDGQKKPVTLGVTMK